MKRKELLWMLIPCLLFAGYAVYLQLPQKRESVELPGRTTGPFSWRVRKIERGVLTAREVGLGYSDKWTLDLLGEGAAPVFKAGWSYDGPNPQPQNLRLVAKINGRETLVKLAAAQRLDSFSVRADGESGEMSARRLKLTFLIPPVTSPDELWLKSEILSVHDFFIKSPNSTNYESVQSPPQPFSFCVRKRGESVLLPVVSRYCPLQITQSKVIKFGPANSLSCPVEVEVRVVCTDAELNSSNPSYRFEMPRIVDDGGQEFYTHSRGTSTGGGSGVRTVRLTGGLDMRGWYGPPLNKRKGQLWLESFVSLNDGWPRKIKVLLRGAPSSQNQSKP